MRLFRMQSLVDVREMLRKRVSSASLKGAKRPKERKDQNFIDEGKNSSLLGPELESTSQFVFVGDNPFQGQNSSSVNTSFIFSPASKHAGDQASTSRLEHYRVKPRESKDSPKEQIKDTKAFIKPPALKLLNLKATPEFVSPLSTMNTIQENGFDGGEIDDSPLAEESPPMADCFVKNQIINEENLLLPVQSNSIPVKPTSGSQSRLDYSPVTDWSRSPSASVTVLKAEVAKLAALNKDANKAVDRAHHQIEEQEIFAATLQKQLRVNEKELGQKEERLQDFETQYNDAREQLTETTKALKAKDNQIDELKHQVIVGQEERREYEKEVQRQRELVQTGDSALESLKDEYYQLQKALKAELSRLEHSSSEEQRLTDLLTATRKEYDKTYNKQVGLISENKNLQQENSKLETTCSALKQLLGEAHAENSRLNHDLSQERSKTQEINQKAKQYAISVASQEFLKEEKDRPLTSSQQDAELGAFESTSSRFHPVDYPYLQAKPPTETKLKTTRTTTQTEDVLKWDTKEEDSAHHHSSARLSMTAPYSTEKSLQDLHRVTCQLETRLMHLSVERNELESEYARMPARAGRTIAARSRKHEVEARLDTIDEEMCRIRLKLKYVSGNLVL